MGKKVMRIGEKREALIGGIGTRIGTHASRRDDVVNYFQEWFLARSRHALDTAVSKLHLRLPCHADRRFADRQSPSDYYACPSAMITANTPVCRPH